MLLKHQSLVVLTVVIYKSSVLTFGVMAIWRIIKL